MRRTNELSALAKPYMPSLIFKGKAYPRWKHAGLFVLFVSDEEKSFLTLTVVVNDVNFSLPLTNRPNKLAYLPMTSLTSPQALPTNI